MLHAGAGVKTRETYVKTGNARVAPSLLPCPAQTKRPGYPPERFRGVFGMQLVQVLGIDNGTRRGRLESPCRNGNALLNINNQRFFQLIWENSISALPLLLLSGGLPFLESRFCTAYMNLLCQFFFFPCKLPFRRGAFQYGVCIIILCILPFLGFFHPVFSFPIKSHTSSYGPCNHQGNPYPAELIKGNSYFLQKAFVNK